MRLETAQNVAATNGAEAESRSVAPPSVSCITLTRIAAPLMKQLTGLVHGVDVLNERIRQLEEELRCSKQRELQGRSGSGVDKVTEQENNSESVDRRLNGNCI